MGKQIKKLTKIYNSIMGNDKYREIIMYLFVGGATTAVSWISYSIAAYTINCGRDISNIVESISHLKIQSASIEIFLANVVSWILAVLFAYITNKLLVFRSFCWKPSYVFNEIFLFVSSRLITGLLEIIGVPLLVALGLNQTVFGIEGSVSKVVVSVLVIILNYVLSKLFVFNRKEDEAVFGSSDIERYDTDNIIVAAEIDGETVAEEKQTTTKKSDNNPKTNPRKSAVTRQKNK